MKLALIIAAVLGLSLFSVEAKRPAHAGGPQHATIALDQTEPVSGSATFTVTQSNYKNPHLLWVANKCYEGGELVSAQYLPVVWNADASVGSAGSFTVSGDNCTAYVWEFPNSETPEGHGQNQIILTYSVAP